MLRLPADFDFDWVLGFLGARAAPALDSVGPLRYQRSVRLDEGPIALSVRCQTTPDGKRLLARAAPPLRRGQLRALVVRMFDLGADLAAFRACAARDPILRRLVSERPGIRLPLFLDPFEGLVRAILGQQVSVAAATTLVDRLVRWLGDPAPPLDGSRFLAFPRPEAVAAAGPARLRRIGLTRAKASALHGAAEAVLDGTLDWQRLGRASPDEAQAVLLSLPGVGPWTAAYVRMRVLGDRDALPSADLGLLKALTTRGRRPTARQVESRAEAWRPWRAYATLHLWDSLGRRESEAPA